MLVNQGECGLHRYIAVIVGLQGRIKPPFYIINNAIEYVDKWSHEKNLKTRFLKPTLTTLGRTV